jgi:hypothetical protein
MSRLYADEIVVWSIDGRPVRFVWRDQSYKVIRILHHWGAVRDWWRPVVGDRVEDYQFWRLVAAPYAGSDADAETVEMRHEFVGGRWMLSRAWDR